MLKKKLHDKRSGKMTYKEIPVKLYQEKLFSLVAGRGKFCPCAAVGPAKSQLGVLSLSCHQEGSAMDSQPWEQHMAALIWDLYPMGSSDHTCSTAKVPSGSNSLLLLLIRTAEGFLFIKYKWITGQTDVCSLNYENLLGYPFTAQNRSLIEVGSIMLTYSMNVTCKGRNGVKSVSVMPGNYIFFLK